jgi:hypothetical protein
MVKVLEYSLEQKCRQYDISNLKISKFLSTGQKNVG